MSSFYSAYADYLLCALTIALLLSGCLCLSIVRDNVIVRTFYEWHFLAPVFLLLAVRAWFGIYGLSNEHNPALVPISILLLGGASLCLLAAAHRKVGGNADEAPGLFDVGNLLDLLLLLAILIISLGSAAFFFHTGTSLERAGPPFNHAFLISKSLFFLLSVHLFYRNWRLRDRPSPMVIQILLLICLMGFLFFISVPPRIPATPNAFTTQKNSLFAGIFIALTLVTLALAIHLWNCYAKTRGVTSKIRWWPIVLMLSIFLTSFAFIHLAHRRNYTFVKRNIVDSAIESTDRLNLTRLKVIIASPELFQVPDRAELLFNRIRKSHFYVGHTEIAVEMGLLIRPDPIQPPILLADPQAALYPNPDLGPDWSRDRGLQEQLWHSVDNALSAAFPDTSGRLNPTFVSVPIHDTQPAAGAGENVEPVLAPHESKRLGVAIFAVSSIDLARDSYNFKSLFLYFLPLGFLALFLLLSGQQRAWLAEHSSRHDEAMRLGALGNGLAGTIIVRNDIIIDCNQRVLEFNHLARNQLIGKRLEEAFDVVSPDDISFAYQAAANPDSNAPLEVSIRRPDGGILHVLTQCRSISNTPGNRINIWDSVDITGQKVMEQHYRASRDDLQTILDTLPIPVSLKGESGIFQTGNLALAKYLGLQSSADVVGHSIVSLPRPDPAATFYDPEIEQMLDRQALANAGNTVVFDHHFVLNGERMAHEITKTAVVSADKPSERLIVSSIHDFTNRKRSEDALIAEQHFHLQLIDTLPNPVCFIDRQRVIRLCNQAFCDEAGASSFEDLVGRPYDEVKPLGPVDVEFEESALAIGQGRSETRFEFVKNDTVRNFVLIRNVVVSAEGVVMGLLKVFWDTTDLVAATRAARQAERAKAAFLTGMSHELRTPMNGIVGMADLITDHDSTRPLPRLYAETIVRSAKTLQMAIDEVMDVATIEDARQRLDLKKEPFSLLSLVEDAAGIVSCIAEAWGIELSLGYDFTLDEKFLGDPVRIRQILVQVLTYCSRISLDRRLRLEVAAVPAPLSEPVTAPAAAGSGTEPSRPDAAPVPGPAPSSARKRLVGFQAIFIPSSSITPQELVERFRNPSGQAQDGRTLVFGNISHRIGLPLIWKLVELMGGTLDAFLQDGQLHCRVVIPFASVDFPAQISAPNLSGLRVLAATDFALRADSIRSSLAYARAEVTLAMNLDEVRRQLASPERDGNPFQLLILDQRLTPMDGLEMFLRELDEKQNSLPAKPPRHIILVVSSRQAQNLSDSRGRIKYLLLPPLTPSELWAKAFALSRPNLASSRSRSLPVTPGGPDEDTVVISPGTSGPAPEGAALLASGGGPKHSPPSETSTRAFARDRGQPPAAKASNRNSTSITNRPPRIPARVLLAEDNTVNQMVAMGILKRIGATTVLAKNGQEAVDLILQGEVFDLIFMDCMMPLMDGYHATAMIRLYERGTPGAKRHPIVALTANNVEGDRERCLAAGMDEFIAKPASLNQLREIMVKYCGELTGTERSE